MLPEAFLTLAEELGALGGPAQNRSAISRAYYAVFNAAERMLQRMSFHPPKTNHHVVLQRRLLVSGDAELMRIGSDLGDFHQERIHADYRLNDPDPENPRNVEAALKKAARMIGALNACPINSERWMAIRAEIAKANITGTDNVGSER